MYFAILTIVAVALAIATGRVYRRPAANTLAAASLALAVGFVVLSVCVSLTYFWRPARQVQGQLLVALPALLVFGMLFVTHLVKHRPRPEFVIAAVVLCGLAVYFLGLFVWLLTACSFGDCI